MSFNPVPDSLATASFIVHRRVNSISGFGEDSILLNSSSFIVYCANRLL